MNSSEFNLVNPLDVTDWDTRVLSSGSTCVFHSKAWARTLSESYGFEPIYLAQSRGNHYSVLVPLMDVSSWPVGPRGVSLPFSDYCDWISPSDKTERVFHIVREAGRVRHWKSLEARNSLSWPKTACSCQTMWLHELDLNHTPEELWQGLKSEVRTAIRKAQRMGIGTRFTNTLEDLRIFFRLHCLTRRRLGVPPQPWSFFERVYTNIIASGQGEIGTASRKGDAIASAIYFYFGRTAFYKYGASDPCALALRGNNALMWEAIRRCAHNGFATLSMGRTGLPDSGLRRYKLGWGCRESPLDYFRYDYQLNQFSRKLPIPANWTRGILRMTPIMLLRLTGNLLYPHRS